MPQYQRLVIAPHQFQHDQITLNPKQQHYLTAVLRLSPGAQFIAMNGQGQWWLAQLSGPETAKLLNPIDIATELPCAVTLCIAPAKGNQFDDVVRITTEIGVARIVPILSQRTLLKPSPHKFQRWQRIAAEAAEQSCRQVIPELIEPLSVDEALQWLNLRNQGHTDRYLCVTDATAPHLLRCLEQPHTEVVLMTGPEGGWTRVEAELAIAHHFRPISLGHRILRAVTAPITALSIVAAHLEATHQGGTSP